MEKPKRICIYIFDWQLRKIEEIAEKRGKRKRHIFFEMIMNYIDLYKKGKI